MVAEPDTLYLARGYAPRRRHIRVEQLRPQVRRAVPTQYRNAGVDAGAGLRLVPTRVGLGLQGCFDFLQQRRHALGAVLLTFSEDVL